MTTVVIGVDPAKRSHSMAVVDDREQQLAALTVVNDSAGYRDMLRLAKRWPQRTWAVEGASGVGTHLRSGWYPTARVLDVPPKLSARARIFDTGHGHKNDPADARLCRRAHGVIAGSRSGSVLAPALVVRGRRAYRRGEHGRCGRCGR